MQREESSVQESTRIQSMTYINGFALFFNEKNRFVVCSCKFMNGHNFQMQLTLVLLSA